MLPLPALLFRSLLARKALKKLLKQPLNRLLPTWKPTLKPLATPSKALLKKLLLTLMLLLPKSKQTCRTKRLLKLRLTNQSLQAFA